MPAKRLPYSHADWADFCKQSPRGNAGDGALADARPPPYGGSYGERDGFSRSPRREEGDGPLEATVRRLTAAATGREGDGMVRGRGRTDFCHA